MLLEFQRKAEELLQGHDHKIIQTYTEDGRRMSDEIFVRILTPGLEELGYYLATSPEYDGYFRLYQPTIRYKSGEPYGDIPDGMLNQNKQRS